jgi:hypothetical protein
MIRTGRIPASKAMVSAVPFRDPLSGSVLQEIRRSDGSKVIALSRDTHERALSRAKLVLARK